MHFRQLLVSVLTVAAVIGLVGCAASSAKRHAESMMCGNYMCSICIAARPWADDHDGYLPSDLRSMSDYLPTNFLICPGDHSRKPAASWASFTPAQSSYEIVTPHLKDGDTNGVFLRCKIHGHLGYGDGTIFDGVRRRKKIDVPE
jgi:hypothetical protein